MTKERFSIIVAVDAAMGIGKGNALPWRLSADMKHFKEVTTREYVPGKMNAVLMGRKTWESLPEKFRPLPGRLNTVITSAPLFFLPDGVRKYTSFDQAVRSLCVDPGIGKVFVIGGANVFAQAVEHPLCGELFLTQIEKVFDCDTFFPSITSYYREYSSSPLIEEGGTLLKFIYYLRH